MNNDLISREALKKALKSNCDLCHDKNTNWCEHCCPLNDFEDLIDDAPSVEDRTKEVLSLQNTIAKLVDGIAENKKPQGDIFPMEIVAGKCPIEDGGNCPLKPQGDWIPVSERLPEYSGLYLISIYDLVTVANFTGKHFCDRQMDIFVDVFAWQPLPKPYKEGDDKNV